MKASNRDDTRALGRERERKKEKERNKNTKRKWVNKVRHREKD
jgi:hypothetical protein